MTARTSTVEQIRARCVIDDNGCWLWQLSRSSKGYALGSVSGTFGSVHRAAYVLANGPIPSGLQLDHLCRVRHCVNPAHLEPVTSRENTLRAPSAVAAINAAKTHCKRGHEFTDENTRRTSRGGRNCRACARLAAKHLA